MHFLLHQFYLSNPSEIQQKAWISRGVFLNEETWQKSAATLILVWGNKNRVSQLHGGIYFILFFRKGWKLKALVQKNLATHDVSLSSRLLHTVESDDRRIRGERWEKSFHSTQFKASILKQPAGQRVLLGVETVTGPLSSPLKPERPGQLSRLVFGEPAWWSARPALLSQRCYSCWSKEFQVPPAEFQTGQRSAARAAVVSLKARPLAMPPGRWAFIVTKGGLAGVGWPRLCLRLVIKGSWFKCFSFLLNELVSFF